MKKDFVFKRSQLHKLVVLFVAIVLLVNNHLVVATGAAYSVNTVIVNGVTAVGASTFGIYSSSTIDQTAKFKEMLESDYNTIYLPSGTYRISDTLVVSAGVAKKIIGGDNTVISASLSSDKKLMTLNTNVSFENIIFDFNNGNVSMGLNYQEGLGEINLKNLTFKNVKDLNSTTSTMLLKIASYGNIANVDGIDFYNIKKLGNGIVGDGPGNATCLYFGPTVTLSGLYGTIKNIKINELHNINSSGTIVNEDTSGVYLSSNYTGSASLLKLDGVFGNNSGKRLIKIDAKNIEINNVTSTSTLNDQLCAIGINSSTVASSNIKISNVDIKGITNIGISVDGSDVSISNAKIDITKGNWDEAFGIIVSNDRISVENSTIKAGRCIFIYKGSSVLKDFKLLDSQLTVNENGTFAIQYSSSSKGFDNILIQNVTSVYKPVGLYKISFIDMGGLLGTADKSGNNLKILNCTSYSSARFDISISLKSISNFQIDNFTSNNTEMGYRTFQFNTCSNGTITKLHLNANVNQTFSFINSPTVKEIVSYNTPSDALLPRTLSIEGDSTLYVNGDITAQYLPILKQGTTKLSTEKVIWYISGNSEANVDSNGVVKVNAASTRSTVKVGAILASDQTIRYEKTINLVYGPAPIVVPEPIDPTPSIIPLTLNITGADTITVDDTHRTFQFTGTVYKGTTVITGEKIVWYISGNSEVNVDASGVIYVGSSSTRSTVKVGGMLASDNSVKFEKLVNIIYGTPAVVVPGPKVLTINGSDSLDVKLIGDKFQYTATVTQDGIVLGNEKVIWYISGNSYCDVNGSGLVQINSNYRDYVKVCGMLASDPTIKVEKLVHLNFY